jgi:hypothetical protein
MIKSKIKTLGFWITPMFMVFFIGIFIFIFFSDPLEKDRGICSGVIITLLSLNIFQLWVTLKSIKINTIDRTIIFSHLFTGRITTYNFSDIDGYVDVIEQPAQGRPFRILYLVKEERFVQKISGFIYSNLNEIEDGLKATKYLGRKEYSYRKDLKALFGKKD